MNDKLLIKILFLIIFIFILAPIIFFLLKIIYKSVIPKKDLAKRYGERSWVVITGASRGQGKHMAEEFAADNFNLILIGSERSFDTAKSIKAKHPNCQIKVIVRDFSKSLHDDDWWKEIEDIFDGTYDISILVNNVGQRTASNPSHLQNDNKIRQSMITGTYPQVRLTKLALNFMIERLKNKPQYKCGVIFNTAQCIHPTFLLSQFYSTGEISVPYLSVYEAANAFGFYHANSLIKEYELSHPNIDMINIMPGAVLTENTEFLNETPFAVDVKIFAKNIVRLLGNWRGATCAHWGHDLSSLLIGLGPWEKDPMLRKVGLTLSENLQDK